MESYIRIGGRGLKNLTYPYMGQLEVRPAVASAQLLAILAQILLKSCYVLNVLLHFLSHFMLLSY